jgi:hypothetical protein
MSEIPIPSLHSVVSIIHPRYFPMFHTTSLDLSGKQDIPVSSDVHALARNLQVLDVDLHREPRVSAS